MSSQSETHTFIPYGRQHIEESDIVAVDEVLRSDWLTTGPKVKEFEHVVSLLAQCQYAVALSSGTAALHAAMHAAQIGPGDEVIVPPLTFAATSNSILYQGGTPVFSDVSVDTGLIDPELVESKISSHTRAIVAVDYCGQPCDYDRLRTLCDKHGLILIADACHSLGATYQDRPVGSLADLTIFSFHPVKQITTGEGGMVVTNRPVFADRIRQFRNHGINSDHRQREDQGTWFYEMQDLGFNYRITDIQCALGIAQMKKLKAFLSRRQAIARRYGEAFTHVPALSPLDCKPYCSHAYHLYIVRVSSKAKYTRREAFEAFRQKGIGVNVHYIPVYLHPYYRRRFSYSPGLCPAAEQLYETILSLPIWPGMTDSDVNRVIETTRTIFGQQ